MPVQDGEAALLPVGEVPDRALPGQDRGGHQEQRLEEVREDGEQQLVAGHQEAGLADRAEQEEPEHQPLRRPRIPVRDDDDRHIRDPVGDLVDRLVGVVRQAERDEQVAVEPSRGRSSPTRPRTGSGRSATGATNFAAMIRAIAAASIGLVLRATKRWITPVTTSRRSVIDRSGRGAHRSVEASTPSHRRVAVERRMTLPHALPAGLRSLRPLGQVGGVVGIR